MDKDIFEKVISNAECLYDQQQVDAAIDKMADKIESVLADKNPLLICVMNGGIVLTGKLMTRLPFQIELDYLHATRYRNSTSGSEIEWIAEPRVDLQGRVVLIVDDILDEGITLKAITDYCDSKGAQKIFTAVLVDKKINRTNGFQKPDFTGLEIENKYVFGYGMDYKGYLRNAAGIYAVQDQDQ